MESQKSDTTDDFHTIHYSLYIYNEAANEQPLNSMFSDITLTVSHGGELDSTVSQGLIILCFLIVQTESDGGSNDIQ